MNKTGNMTKRNGRYQGSIQEKRDRLLFQKDIAEILKFCRKKMLHENPTLKPVIQDISNNYILEKIAIEKDY